MRIFIQKVEINSFANNGLGGLHSLQNGVDSINSDYTHLKYSYASLIKGYPIFGLITSGNPDAAISDTLGSSLVDDTKPTFVESDRSG